MTVEEAREAVLRLVYDEGECVECGTYEQNPHRNYCTALARIAALEQAVRREALDAAYPLTYAETVARVRELEAQREHDA